MFRIIIYFLIFYFIYKLIKSFKSSNQGLFKNKVKPNFEEKEKMVKCENCGLYSPESSNLIKNGKYFCSEKCMKEYFKNEKN